MIKKITTSLLLCLTLAGCSLSAEDKGGESAAETNAAPPQQAAASEDNNTNVTDTPSGESRTAAFAERINGHDFAITLNSQQPGGVTVVEEVEVCGNVLHDVYKTPEGQVTSELYIVDGGIWSVTNEGSTEPMYLGFDNQYDAHVRECALHWMNIGEGDFTHEQTDVGGEKITSADGNTEMTYVFGADGVPVYFDGGGAHYDVTGYREGLGSIELPENLKNAMAQRESS